MKHTTYLLALFATVAVAAPAGVKRSDELDTCELTSDGSTGGVDNETVEDVSILDAICSLGTPLCCDGKSLKCIALTVEQYGKASLFSYVEILTL
ncbi:uncharacterized protein ColSpa_00432 [Colletotrichum spaethianum]|uniref:Hydrophobin n=1 Tax=Colletotrichum spaethianum TaxID=700344 RepID=A0AA37P446_9PEZI|nr:uncharacterized protein ColSpa_00432 [Colletotrichum spaethianum]GKT40251.1 hypothetical protein ColSpa_00432 [Colletotrichum spaethianum]